MFHFQNITIKQALNSIQLPLYQFYTIFVPFCTLRQIRVKSFFKILNFFKKYIQLHKNQHFKHRKNSNSDYINSNLLKKFIIRNDYFYKNP